ncbi:MAG: BF3164 family lipoprotein [Candidatus Cloacimonadales bacterium]
MAKYHFLHSTFGAERKWKIDRYQMRLLLILSLFLIILSQISCSKDALSKDLFAISEKLPLQLKNDKKINHQFKRSFKITDFNDISFDLPVGIELADSTLFIQDENNIYLFDQAGNYLNQIGKKGNGPGEFRYLRDFAVDQAKIYCLDKIKMSLSIFSTKNCQLIKEQRIPDLVCQNISLEQVAVSKGDIYLSGFTTPQEELEIKQSLVYKLDADMTILDSYFQIDDYYMFESVEEKMLLTANLIAVDEDIAYMGMLIGDNLLYAFDLNKKNYLFKVSKEINSLKKHDTIQKERGGVELMSLYNILQISVIENYIITSEEAGQLKDEDLSPSYYNNLSFYSKDGEYLFSFEDRDLAYSLYGIYGAVEELDDGFYIYLVSPEESAFYKYFLAKPSGKL